jgi:anti-sigma-K factor RskA
MREAHGPNGTGEGLALHALLYASGELDAAEAEAFERRLGEDQAAREALAGAVPLALALGGGSVTAPDPAYRARVRQLLRPRAGVWQRLWDRRPYRGHPVFWGAVGAAAAALVMFAVFRWPGTAAPATGLAPPAEQQVASLPADEHPLSPEAVERMANVWAEMNNNEHLLKAREEEQRRKVRAEERGRGLKGEERRARPLGNAKSRY